MHRREHGVPGRSAQDKSEASPTWFRATRMRRAVITRYEVAGIACGGCASGVRAAVGALDGVIEVEVDLETGDVIVSSTIDVTAEARAAIADAGYDVVS